ncbi:hypothetical protein HII36_46790 [Nonomuraea sp. NN258]|uniref:hypothetical protein n=1 Tax=Nonomuraea antri TaxID=2730852 RepID=UPI00156A0E88|nr:hypothetical protein [Nonomuraea antri]NRQ39281.1 hypothetical protein [Nonomuraea antri]
MTKSMSLAAAAVPLALLLAAGAVVTPAYAATGEFFFETGPGRMLRLFNPPSGRCIRLPDPSPAVANHTDRTAHLWASTGCTGEALDVPSGGTWRKDGRAFARSVRFD